MKRKKIIKNPWFIGISIALLFFILGLIFYKGYIQTEGDYSPGVVEGDYQKGDDVARDKVEGDYIAGDSILGDKIEAENVTIYADPETAKDVEKSIKRISHDGKNIRINVYDRESDKMKEVVLAEGKSYSSYSKKGARIDYMRKEDKIYVEYTAPGENWTAYYVTDFEGNLIDSKFPYDIKEYTVEIPEELELRRQENPLFNGWKHIHVDLKWDKSVDLIYDDNGALKQISIKGGARISHNAKKIIVLHPRQNKK